MTRARPVAAVLFAVLLAGCDDLIETPPDPPVLRLRADIPGDGDDKLRGAVFTATAGSSVAQATARLEAEGFTCDGARCELRQTVREAAWVASSPFSIRPPGPARSWERVTGVTFLADPVATPEAIAVDWGAP